MIIKDLTPYAHMPICPHMPHSQLAVKKITLNKIMGPEINRSTLRFSKLLKLSRSTEPDFIALCMSEVFKLVVA